MINAIKVLLTIAIMLLFTYPFITVKGKIRALFVGSRLKYESPENCLNLLFVILAIVEFVVLAFVFKLLDKLAEIVTSIPFISGLLSGVQNSLNSQVDYIIFAVKLILINLIVIYTFIFFKSLLKKILDYPETLLERKKKKAEKKKNKKKKNNEQTEDEDTTPTPEDEEKEKKKNKRVTDFVHTIKGEVTDEGEDGATDENGEPIKKKKERSKFTKWLLSIFFEGEDYKYARGWVVRVRSVLQIFIRLIQILYFIFFLSVLISSFFVMPKVIYDVLINVLKVGNWYLYPALSVIFLQEICNVFDTPLLEEKVGDEKKQEEEEKSDEERAIKIRALLAELKSRFDTEHTLRYYPETTPEKLPEYECTSVMYKSALEYIRNTMQNSSGHVVQSYMECLDAIFSDENVYFAASFYSEFGEYLIAYTYIRLQAGARQIFVVSNPDEKETLRQYINDRLMRITGSSATATWRVYTADENLDQADILIATPEDFVKADIVEQHPAFFEETCNAVFIDTDKLISLDSYLCPILATKLQRSTAGRVRFVFLTLNLMKGIAQGSIPRFFSVDKVLSFSSAKENEAVSYVLWNKESKSHRIYNKDGQKNSSLETIIADQAFRHGIDGVRLITESQIEHAERKMLSLHEVEINNLYKNIVDVNYMIYSDERCNLSAALYACTRFRGRKSSVVHILSKPYLLREYFMAKAITEDHVNRFSFIQPRVTEHVESHRLSLVRIFCDASSDTGMPVSAFEDRVRDVIIAARERAEKPSSAYCYEIIRNKRSVYDLKLDELCAYLVAGICDTKHIRESDSAGNKAKNFYIVVDTSKREGFNVFTEKCIIFNKVRDVFNALLEYNRRVELRLNDEVIGLLETFPSRVHYEYIEGQSILFNNSEYEIDHINKDGTAIYLRHENISIKNCLDTVLLRKYGIKNITPEGQSAVLNNSQSVLEEIRVTRCKADVASRIFGFYSLTSDRQTLDFYRGVEGNLNFDTAKVFNRRANMLSVELVSLSECTDGMRMLLSTVFNEFIKTLFPDAYHCVAICPVLMDNSTLEKIDDKNNPIDRVKTLYPYIKGEDEADNIQEYDPHRMQFYFINDCDDDIGVLDWFYDHSARYMQEFLANVYSYLHWLKLRPEKNHYIYYGGKELPPCYDLEGCCEVLSDFNLILSDGGKKDIETAGDDTVFDKIEYCSFCHKIMESGRYSYFDNNRYICADCFDVVSDEDRLRKIFDNVKEYLAKTYPSINLSATIDSMKVKLDKVYDLKPGEIFSENYYRLDFAEKTVYVEMDNPVKNVFVSILRGIITFWQIDNELANDYSGAQLYFEELAYLRSISENEIADWVYNNIPADVRENVDAITAFINKQGESTPDNDEEKDSEKNTDSDTEGETPENETDAEEGEGESSDAEEGEGENTDAEEDSEKDNKDKTDNTPAQDDEVRNSFIFMRKRAEELDDEDWEDPKDDEYSDSLYDPNSIPRFWKRYLRNERIDDDHAEDVSGAEDEEEEDEEEGESPEPNSPGERIFKHTTSPNAPIEDDGLTDDTGSEFDDITDEDPALDKKAQKLLKKQQKAEEKRRKQEERKRLKEEKRRRAIEEREKRIVGLTEEEEEERRRLGLDKKPKKKSFFDLFKKKKKPEDEIVEDETTDETEDNEDGLNDGTDNDVVDNETGDTTGDESDGSTDDESDGSTDDQTDDTEDENTSRGEKKPEKDKKKAPKKAPKKKKPLFDKNGRKLSRGERMLPKEDDEDTNPRIKLYNDIVRAAYDYSEEAIPRNGLSDDEVLRIFTYVKGDYPELFWVAHYSYTSTHIYHEFRCKDANGRLDIKQIEKKRAEIRKGAKFFTRGITKKTDPYKALLTIYRRLILNLDYDMVGLRAGIDADTTRDDALRSLYGAFVERKVVCAGYAAALQYLLQSVGIVNGYVISEINAENICHAFNIVKIGKYCYYVDTTWGDPSTNDSKDFKDLVLYKYFCTPYDDFLKAEPNSRLMHTPRKTLYPDLAKLKYTNHEYYRYHKAFVKSYNEEEILKIIVSQAIAYDPDEMGEFTISFRCPNEAVLNYVHSMLWDGRKLDELLVKAADRIRKKHKKVAKRLDQITMKGCLGPGPSGIVTYYFPKKSKK